MSPSLPARGLLGLIQLYKWTLSPIIGRGCRYLPTCSTYAADCIRMHGAWAGSWMAGARICRCAPWGGHGWDPAPRVIKKSAWWRPWKYGDWKGGYRAPPSSPLPRGEGAGRTTTRGGADTDATAMSQRSSPPTPSPQGRGGSETE